RHLKNDRLPALPASASLPLEQPTWDRDTWHVHRLLRLACGRGPVGVDVTRERGQLSGVRILPGNEALPAGDYVSPGLLAVMPDACFPNMIVGDKAAVTWPYLRREVPHNWYCDRRRPLVGFLNRDEVLLLYNLAVRFRGKPALEIGCWMGWSTCHLALAGLALDVLDPVLAEPEGNSVRGSLADAGVLANVRLCAMPSPAGIGAL